MEGPLAIAQAFTEQTFHYTSQAELASGLEACTFELGFHRFAILHHVDLRRRPAAMIHIDNYPADWSEHFIQKRLFLADPILRASLTTYLGFSCEDVTALISISPSQRRFIKVAGREGLKSGFTVLALIPDEAHDTCSFS